MKENLSKLLSFIYTFILSIRKNSRHINNNKILLIVAGHMGNAVLIIDGLLRLGDYCKRNGKILDIACDDYMWKTLNNLQDLSEFGYLKNVLTNNGRFFIKNLIRIRRLTSKLKYEKIITSLPINNVDHFLAITIRCNENWCLQDDIKKVRNIRTFGFKFIEMGYSNLVKVPIDMSESLRYKRLFAAVGVDNYNTQIFDIRKKLNAIYADKTLDNSYVTIALDSMNQNRRWHLKNFSVLIERLLALYEYDIVLTGTTINEKECKEYITNKFYMNPRVYDYIGKTNFHEWLYILSRAKFHIGVDSGSIHFATSVGTQAFCITGVWDAHRVFPYFCEDSVDGLHEPICIYRTDVDVSKLPCYACKVRGIEFGTSNDRCKKNCKLGKPCECLEKVTPEDVLNVISDYQISNCGRTYTQDEIKY